MKILLIGQPANKADSYSSMWMRYLPAAFEAAGIEIAWFRRLGPEDYGWTWAEELLLAAQDCDHILAPGVRYFTTIPRDIANYITKAFSGTVSQICDGSLLDGGPVDVNFTVRDDAWRYIDNSSRLRRHHAHNFAIGWAADETLFYPEPVRDGALRIFVDHPAFDCKFDYTLTLLMNIAAGRSHIRAAGYDRLIVRTLTDAGLVDVDLDNIQVMPFHRTHVPVEEFSAELRRADIFIVTHQESLGLTALEAAKCGARVLCPAGTIASDRLERLDHQVITKPLDWPEVLQGLSKEKAAARVAGETWAAVTQQILKGINTWSR